ncbi:hypothetical protein PgNI_05945 [Pyricularia grisea]|uniref:Uncharacterized protein n=1 Tax=Pyricularia grisea TaxID=148305 RepID=A0A6P8B494_PYRGI|nr:hypothetical protein PgNI_05945 [Pyricularia grisea]TLD10117.1 hypothetical protein PgNI_05945 [Pyricularia grisea]
MGSAPQACRPLAFPRPHDLRHHRDRPFGRSQASASTAGPRIRCCSTSWCPCGCARFGSQTGCRGHS